MMRTMRWATMACVVAAVTAWAAASARGEVDMRWKYKAGETIRYTMIQDMIQNVNVPESGGPMKMTMTQTMDLTWRVEAVSPEGVANLTQTIDRVRMKMQGPQGVLIDYDSDSNKEPEGMAKLIGPMYQALVKKPIVLKITDRGQVVDFKMPQGFVESINKMMGGVGLGNLFSEEGLKQMAEVGSLPDKPVKVGDTWERKVAMKASFLGLTSVETTFRYEGQETRDGRTLEKISTVMQMKSAPQGDEKAKPDAKQPQVGLTIDQQENKGTIYFDAAAGKLVESDVKTRMKMDMQVMGKKISQDIDMTVVMKAVPAEKETQKTETQK